MLQYTEDVACHRTWVTDLFQLQYQVLLVLAFALAGRVPELGKGMLSRIPSKW